MKGRLNPSAVPLGRGRHLVQVSALGKGRGSRRNEGKAPPTVTLGAGCPAHGHDLQSLLKGLTQTRGRGAWGVHRVGSREAQAPAVHRVLKGASGLAPLPGFLGGLSPGTL